MTIDISDPLRGEQGEQKRFVGQVSYKDTIYQGDRLHFDTPLEVECTAINGRDCVYLAVNVHGEMKMPCSRCAKLFVNDIDLSFTEEIKDVADIADEEDELDIFTYQDGKLRIDRMIYEQIILGLPIKRVCSDGCRGLCPKCGIDLNQESCNCDRDDDIDIRLLELKKLLPSNNEEV